MSVELCGLDLRQPLRTDCFVYLNLSWVDWRDIPVLRTIFFVEHLLRCQVNRSQTGLEIGKKTPSSMAIGEMNDNPIYNSSLNVFHGTKVPPHFQTQLDRSFSEDQGLGGSRHCNNRMLYGDMQQPPKNQKASNIFFVEHVIDHGVLIGLYLSIFSILFGGWSRFTFLGYQPLRQDEARQVG